MARLPSRKTLEGMKRVDIQKLCKDYGVKANLKTEALIDLLLGVNAPPVTQASQPQPRIVSTRRSSRVGPSRTSSLIIHDVDDEDDEDPEQEEQPQDEEEEKEPALEQPPAEPHPRTRKAKETQLRLGVGRPRAAGGSGARAVTKSLSLSKGKRAKSSKTMKPSEAPILEEEEGQEPSNEPVTREAASPAPPDADASDQRAPETTYRTEPSNTSTTVNVTQADIDKYIANAVQPFREQLSTLQAEMDRFKNHANQVDMLQSKIDSLTTQIDDLRAQTTEAMTIAQELRDALKTPSNPRTPPPRSPRQEVPRAPHSISATTIAAMAGPSLKKGDPLVDPPSPSTSRTTHDGVMLPHPGFALTTLGKRHRDSTATNVTGIIEEGQEDMLSQEELATKVIRPMKKRPKTSKEDTVASPDALAGPSELPSTSPAPQIDLQTSDEPRIPSFTVFHDPGPSEYIDPPPPTNHLPDFFEPSPPSSSRQPSSSTANASENQHPFSFSFLPYTSTPAQPNYIPPMPYPEARQSPTPVGHSRAGLIGRQAGRSEAIQPFGLQPGSRSSARAQENDVGSFVNPAALTRRTSDREREGSEPRPTTPSQVSDPNKPTQESHAKRTTMYGTELEGDTRFGDFGVEGVASGQSLPNFWAGGRF